MGMKETKDMDCISAKPLTESELLRFLDGESNPETGEHLQNCIYCMQRVDALQNSPGATGQEIVSVPMSHIPGTRRISGSAGVF